MKKTTLIALLLAAVAASAAPALATTKLAKGKVLCEAAAKAMTPAPKSVRVDNDQTRFTDATLTFKLKTKNADDTLGTLTCKVDRETGVATIG